MSNITGSVDLLREREQERQARLQLRDEFRDPSPQPIFSQPVKVELEDETSRRIKDTLGDFNQVQHVLINDPKHLIGISRSGAVVAANNTAVTAASRSASSIDHGGGPSAWPSRNHTTSNGLSRSGGNIPNGHGVTKRPHQQVNGLHKPPPPGLDSSSLRRPHPSANVKSGASIDKKQPQHGPSKHRTEHPPKINPITRGYSSSVGHLDQQPPQDSGTRASNQVRSSRSSYHPPTGAPISSDKEHEHSTHHHRRTSSSGSAGAGSVSSAISVNSEKPIVSQNGTVSSTILPNGVVKHHRFQRIPDAAMKKAQLGSGGKHPPLPPKLTIPTQEERSSQIEVETILREMKQAVPPPLTGIQTPKPESGFSFPTENREKDFSRVLEQLGHHALPPAMPPSAPPERIHPTSTKKSPQPQHAGNSPFNLQADLEMSDSDDEGNMVPACKNPHASEINPYNKCPPQPLVNHDENSGLRVDRVGSCVQGNPQTSTKKATAVVPSGSPNGASGPVLSAQSSSSESSDSDSEDSGSESNDSDTSASSEVSDQETSPANKPAPQQWNLSNFFDETKRNHSPVFYGLDTNTNSNVSTVVKDEPPAPPSIQPADKDAFLLVDEDLVSGILEDHDIKEYLESPMDDLFSMDHGLVGMKSEILSPIPTSPVPAPLPLGPRGPRTPPSPPAKDDSEEEDDDDDDKPLKEKQPKFDSRKLVAPKIDPRSEIKGEAVSRASEHKSHRSRSEQFLNSRSKKKSSSRTKDSSTNSDCNHRSDSQFHLDSHFSASNNSKDVSRSAFSEDMSESGTVHPFVTSSSCPVPSSTTPTPKSTHTNPMKSHHKRSSPTPTASSSFSSPKKQTSTELKDGIKSGRHSSKSKSSAKSKSSLELKETANSKSHNKSDKESVADSNTKLSSKHDKSLDAKSKRNPSPTKTKHVVSTKVSRSHVSPCKSSTPKKSKTKSVKSSSGKSSSHHGEDKRKLERKKKSSKFSIKNFLQSPFSPPPVQESCQPSDVKSPSSPTRASESEGSPPPAVPKKSSESSLSLNKVQMEDENDEPSVDQGDSFVPKLKHRKSSISSSSRSRSRSNSRTRLSSAEKTKLKKRSSKSMKRRGSKSSTSDINSSSKKKHHRDTRQPRKPLKKSSVSSSSSASPHNSRHHSPVPPTLCLDLPGHPPELLSPISASENNESAITTLPCPTLPLPKTLMVSILFSKLFRIPERPHHASPPMLKPPKDRPEEVCPQWTSSSPSQSEVAPPTSKSSSSERRSISSVSPCKKDIKTKPRTESSKSSKLGSDHKNIEKSSKSVLHSQSETLSHSKNSNVNNATVTGSRDKTSIKVGADTGSKLSKAGQGCPNVGSKKRKSEELASESSKKKPKVNNTSKSSLTAEAECKEKTVVVKIEKMDTSASLDRRLTPKRLERCDSASSLSSLCSQMSHKSSKSQKERTKESLKDSQETKKLKSILPPAKEIKREKEEKAKIVAKKETTSAVKADKIKSKSKERSSVKVSSNTETKKPPEISRNESHAASSQVSYREDSCKIEETKPQPTNHQRLLPGDQDPGSDWEHFAPEIQHELRGVPNHINKVNTPAPSEYYWQEGKKLKNMAEKEKNLIQQALKYFEATVMFILTSLHRELTNKDPDSIYQIYRETLRFTSVVRSGIQKHLSHSTPGNIDFKILILCLKCQSLLHLKLYNLKIKEVKEQHKGVSDFMHSSTSKLGSHCSPMSGGNSYSRNMSQPSPCQPRIGGGSGSASVPSPHSPTPSPAGSVASVGSQSSGYSSSEVNGNHSRTHSGALLQLPQTMPPLGAVSVPQNMFDTMAKHHSHLSNLHMCHELWEQADMYMTRSNSKDFFKDVADKSERLSLHSNIKELVNYLQTGLSLLKSSYC